uniref:Uncharacterized protein n=2 Tax=Aegilops tauschii TaxID=37682 RepID=N1QUI4_AEGTA
MRWPRDEVLTLRTSAVTTPRQYLAAADGLNRTNTLRRIDTPSLFRPTPPRKIMDTPAAIQDAPLPKPIMSFYPPHKTDLDGTMCFFLLKNGGEGKVIAADHTGRSVLYDLGLHAIRAMPSMKAPKCMPVSLTVRNRLYVLDRIPSLPDGREQQSFEVLTFRQPRYDYGDWRWRSLDVPPYLSEPTCGPSGSGHIQSYALVAGSNICISTGGVGSYSFDTKKRVWSKSGDWALPFSGLAEYVPEHKLWFGMSSLDRGRAFCASDLAAATAVTPPLVHGVWEDATPPIEGDLLVSYAVHLGGGKFCIVRFLEVGTCERLLMDFDTVETIVVFTGVEVERCAGVLHAVQHKSVRYKLADNHIIHWVFQRTILLLGYPYYVGYYVGCEQIVSFLKC